jgi:hypothetical protein
MKSNDGGGGSEEGIGRMCHVNVDSNDTANNSNHFDDALYFVIHKVKYTLSAFMWLTRS